MIAKIFDITLGCIFMKNYERKIRFRKYLLIYSNNFALK